MMRRRTDCVVGALVGAAVTFFTLKILPATTPKNYIVDGISKMDYIDLDGCDFRPARIREDSMIPIFVMTRDRISSLQKTLDSYYETISSPFEIIILDHNSTYLPMVDYLTKLETQKNITVHHLKEETWGGALLECDGVIQRYMAQRPSVGSYVFTDPDIAFLHTAPDVLLFYAGLLQACPNYKVVGPGLQISDIPSQFAKTLTNNKTVYEAHSRFWTDVPSLARWNGVGFHVAKHPIDTTFAMRRRHQPMIRLLGPWLRAYAPYAAVHVDWYDDSKNLPKDKIFYMKRQSGVNNW